MPSRSPRRGAHHDPADAARTLVLDLCAVAGDPEAVSALLLPRDSTDVRAVAAVALIALHICFVECLDRPVAVPEERQ